jgi:hypothetical protein
MSETNVFTCTFKTERVTNTEGLVLTQHALPKHVESTKERDTETTTKLTTRSDILKHNMHYRIWTARGKQECERKDTETTTMLPTRNESLIKQHALPDMECLRQARAREIE